MKTKTIFKVKVDKSDLVGGIKYFPVEVVEKMIEEQAKQGCQPDVEVFQKNPTAGYDKNGFMWSVSEDGYDFWREVIKKHNFGLFFERYPEKLKLVYIVGNSDVGMDIIKTLEKHGGINRRNHCGCIDNVLYYIEPINNTIEICFTDGKDKPLYDVLLTTYTCIDAEVEEKENIAEVSMEEIADMLGVEVKNLRIKK